MQIKENEKRDKYLDLARELKNLWNMKVTIIPIEVGAHGTIPKRLVKKLEDFEINTDHSDYSIKIDQNTEKSLGDLRRLTVSQTPVRNHQLMLV